MWVGRAPGPTCGEVPGTTVHPKSQLRAHRMGVLEKHMEIYHPSPVGAPACMHECAHTHTDHINKHTNAHITYTQKYTSSFNDHSNSSLWDVGCFGAGSQDRCR